MDEQTNITESAVKPTESSSPRLDINKLALPVALVLAALIISGTILYTSRNSTGGSANIAQTNPNQRINVSADDDPAIGNPKAKVTLIEFSDFQCPFCRRFWVDSFNQLKKEYIDTGKARLVFRDFPLPFHPSARPSAEGGACANEQGKFWEYHDKLFSEQQKKSATDTVTFTIADIKKWTSEIGLDSVKFNSCLDSGKFAKEVDKDIADGTTAGVDGTPTMFINGLSVVGAQPYAVFKAAIDKELE